LCKNRIYSCLANLSDKMDKMFLFKLDTKNL
jgi:hypothetical protein